MVVPCSFKTQAGCLNECPADKIVDAAHVFLFFVRGPITTYMKLAAPAASSRAET